MNGYSGDGTDSRNASTIFIARAIAGGMAASLLIMALGIAWMPRATGAGFLVGPIAIFGIVSLAIGYRLFQWMGERVPPSAELNLRQAHFVRASVLAFAVTEAAALLGILVFALTDEVSALIGVLSHAILTGALWPTEERLETFLKSNSASVTGA